LKSINKGDVIKKAKKKDKIKRTLNKEKLGYVNEETMEIEVPKRLRLKRESRIIKLTEKEKARRGITGKNVIGVTKGGTVVKTRKKKK
jgi:hypothetical protein